MGILLIPFFASIEEVTMEKNELKVTRKQMFAQMEQRLLEMHPMEEDRMFYFHSSEFLIPALLSSLVKGFQIWVMTQQRKHSINYM